MLLKTFTLFCSFGGSYIAPFLIPLLNPSCWVVLVLCVFLPIYFSPDSAINSDTQDDGTKKKNGGKAFGFAFLFYYIILVILACSIMQLSCQASKAINSDAEMFLTR
jgi:hypothetical protein